MAAGDRSQSLISEFASLQADLVAAESGARAYGGSGFADDLAIYDAARQGIGERITRITGLIGSEAPGRERLGELQRIAMPRLALLQSYVDRRRTGAAPDPDLVAQVQSRAALNAERAAVDALIADQTHTLAAQQAASVEAQATITRLLLIGGLLLIVAQLAIGYAVIRRLRGGLQQVAEGAERLGHGELDHRIRVTGRDEVAELAAAFNAMAIRLQESNSALDAFAYTVSHDLRAPLRSMQGFSKALLEDYGDRLDTDGKSYATRVVAAAGRMDDLIQDLLAYSRLSRADMALARTPLALAVETVLRRVENARVTANAVIDVQPDLPVVLAHRTTLEQVINNLLNNAIKFTEPGKPPRIRVRAERRNGNVRVWIEDEGIGVAPEHYERIFRVFERLHGSESYPGTGIGLAIVRKGVERMNGRVGVESTVGSGSRFWFELQGGENGA